MNKPIISHSSMTNFQCLGGQCEDSCCRHWDISFDKKHYDRLRINLIDAGKDPTELNKNLYISESANDKNYANVIFNEKGACPFLDGCGLCEIQAEHGVETLSNVCTFFPRFFVEFDQHCEVSGSLSCPEMARKTLLSKSVFELEEIEPKVLPRDHDFPISKSYLNVGDNAYFEKFFDVRKTMLKIMGNNSAPFEARLYTLSSMADALSGFYFDGCDFSQIKPLESELKRFSSDLKLTHTKLMLDQYVPQDPMAIIVVQAVLRLRVQRFPDEAFSYMINASFGHYEQKMKNIPVLPDGNFPPETLMKLYQTEAERLNALFPSLMDKIFSRYVQNSIFREAFTSMPNLFTYVHMLTIRVAMLKFLIVSHPAVIILLDSPQTLEEKQRLLEKKIIEVVYQFSRSIDHNMSFLEIVFYAIAEQEMMHYDFSLPFIKLQASA